MSAGVAAVALAAQVAAQIATSVGTAMKIDEGISDYNAEILNVENRRIDSATEALRQTGVSTAEQTRVVGNVRQEGVLSLREQSSQAAFEARMAFTQAEGVASSQEARLGASGVRSSGSPLLAAQQNVDLAFAAADRTAERGSAGVAIGGVRLGNQIGNITAQGAIQRGNIAGQQTLVTREAQRRKNELRRKRDELQRNRTGMIAISALGGAAGIASSFYQYQSQGAFEGTAFGDLFG